MSSLMASSRASLAPTGLCWFKFDVNGKESVGARLAREGGIGNAELFPTNKKRPASKGSGPF